MSRRQRSKRQKLRRKAAAPRRPDRVASGPAVVLLADQFGCLGCGGASGGAEFCGACRVTVADVARAWSTPEDTAPPVIDGEVAKDEGPAAANSGSAWTERERAAIDEARACLRLCRGEDELTREEMAVTALEALRLAIRLDDSEAWMRQVAA